MTVDQLINEAAKFSDEMVSANSIITDVLF